MSQEYDRSSKWLIEHHGAALLRLAGVNDVVSCRTTQAEIVAPLQMPDALLEVSLAGRQQSTLFLVEIGTYPERRLSEQILRDVLLVILDRRVIPEVVSLVLAPKGVFRVPGQSTLTSELGWTGLQIQWRVVELWNVAAEPMLPFHDVGILPWVPLMHHDMPTEQLLHEVRQRIDRQASGEEHANLLAVTQILMRLRYDDPRLFAIFGGTQAMIESPLIQEMMAKTRHEAIAESTHKAILRILTSRFGSVPTEVVRAVHGVADEHILDRLLDSALACTDLKTFLERLPN
jgi:hypothetical protein